MMSCSEGRNNSDLKSGKLFSRGSKEISIEKNERYEREQRQWFIGGYTTESLYRSKTLSRASYSDSRAIKDPKITMRVLVDINGFSFQIYPGRGNINKRHTGGYKITSVNEAGDEIWFRSRRSGKTVISREGNPGSYERFHEFFRAAERVEIIITDNYASTYRGILDTKYY
jgi:hypothetical protein